MEPSSRKSQTSHGKISHDAKQISQETLGQSDSICGSVIRAGPMLCKTKFPLHVTDNVFHSNELCGITKFMPVAPESNNDLRLFDEIRLGPLAGFLNREKEVFLYISVES
mgnify:FL=1